MSRSPKAPRLDRSALLGKLWDLGRVVSTQAVFIHQAIAASVGLNATDTKCVDVILRGPDGQVTAGFLSEATGLTTGAVTHILDRLEQRGIVERVRGQEDRRKVFVRVRMESLAPLAPRYEALGRAYSALAEQYTDRDLAVICDYLERTVAISSRELAEARAAAQTRASSDEQAKS